MIRPLDIITGMGIIVVTAIISISIIILRMNIVVIIAIVMVVVVPVIRITTTIIEPIDFFKLFTSIVVAAASFDCFL